MSNASTHHPASARRRHRRQGGFTLIEAALATVIVSTGVLSILAAQQAYHRKNNWANHSGTAMLLANEIRELTYGMPMHDPITGASNFGPESGETNVKLFDDLDDFAGVITNGRGAGTTFSPPINALRETIPGMTGWSQHVKVENVLEDNISVSSQNTMAIGSTNLMRITVTVFYQSPVDEEPQVMGTLMWVVGESR